MEETFWEANGDWISALITLVIAFAVAFIVDRFVIAPGDRASAAQVTDTTVSRATRRPGCGWSAGWSSWRSSSSASGSR